MPIRYSGGLVIGDGLIGGQYDHMGFQRAHCFATVTELCFDHGRLIHQTDHSASMAQVRSRKRVTEETSSGIDASGEDYAERIRACFSLNYEDKWCYPLPHPTNRPTVGKR
jgi:hypothetical protein